MQAFILAGGFATRLWPLTEKRAKPLLPLAGKLIIDHIIEQIPSDIPITVSTNAAVKEGFFEWQQESDRKGLKVVVEETKSDDQKLGALGAIATWVEDNQVDDDILLLTGDNYFGFSIKDFIKSFKTGTAILAAFDIKKRDLAKSFGTVIMDKKTGKITGFEEKPKEPKTTLVSTGCSILPKETLPVLIEFAKKHPDNVGGIFEEFLRKEIEIDCYTFKEPWFDIGSFSAYLDAVKTLVGDQVMLGTNAQCDDCKCSGSVIIGDNSKVKDATLTNVVLFDNCTIEDCELENCIVDNNSILRGIDLSGKMLREGTVLMRED